MPVGIADPMFGEFPESAKKTLRDQTIGADHPGTVLADFQTLIDFVGVG